MKIFWWSYTCKFSQYFPNFGINFYLYCTWSEYDRVFTSFLISHNHTYLLHSSQSMPYYKQDNLSSSILYVYHNSFGWGCMTHCPVSIHPLCCPKHEWPGINCISFLQRTQSAWTHLYYFNTQPLCVCHCLSGIRTWFFTWLASFI